MRGLLDWLERNRIVYVRVDDEVVDIRDFGKVFFRDTSNLDSIFVFDRDNGIHFNLGELPQSLIDEGVLYAAFEFGNNFYYYDLREDFRFNILKYVGRRVPMVHDVPFVHLGIHSYFDLLNGSGDLGLWVQKAVYLGHRAMGICDRNTLAGSLGLQVECEKAGIGFVIGYSLTVLCGEDKVGMKVYCQSQRGLENLLRIQKAVMVDSNSQMIGLEDLLGYGQGNVLVVETLSSYWLTDNLFEVERLKAVFDGVFYQVDLSEYKAERIDRACLLALKHFFEGYDRGLGVEPVLICDSYYLDVDDARNKVVLNKIASGAAHRQSNDQYFKDTDELYAALEGLFDGEKWDVEGLFADMCGRTVEIAGGAVARYETGRMFMPEYMMLPEEVELYGDRHRMFLSLLDEGLKCLVAVADRERYRERLDEEVYIIESTNNVDYFLIQWDMVNYARRNGIAVGVGRGSAGGSLVSYLLGVTSIDPIEYGLIFSRFLVPERCGLKWDNEVTVLTEDRELSVDDVFVEVCLEGKRLCFDRDAVLRIVRDGEEMTVYADELRADDDVLFDNRDRIWTLNEV